MNFGTHHSNYELGMPKECLIVCSEVRIRICFLFISIHPVSELLSSLITLMKKIHL